MGVFGELATDFFNHFINRAEDLYTQKYELMPLTLLKEEWNNKFKHRSSSDIYQEHSPDAILDKIYAKRTGNKPWIAKYKK